jgi:hypothetical protein
MEHEHAAVVEKCSGDIVQSGDEEKRWEIGDTRTDGTIGV